MACGFNLTFHDLGGVRYQQDLDAVRLMQRSHYTMLRSAARNTRSSLQREPVVLRLAIVAMPI
jgi:hypothetical protein